jgi:hypothetical protein
MCVHRLYIYTVCGHTIFSSKPIVMCLNASIPPDGCFSTTCDLISHPFQSWQLNSLCPSCEYTRTRLLARIDAAQAITYNEVKWKVSYGMPSHGLDFWGKRAQEREQMEKETGNRSRKSGRWSWRRRRKSKSSSDADARDRK